MMVFSDKLPASMRHALCGLLAYSQHLVFVRRDAPFRHLTVIENMQPSRTRFRTGTTTTKKEDTVRSYKVETEVGIFTRRSARTYTHIVISRGLSEKEITRSSEDHIRYMQKLKAEYDTAVELARSSGLRVYRGGPSGNDIRAGLYDPRTDTGKLLTVPEGDDRIGAYSLEEWQKNADYTEAKIATATERLVIEIEKAKVYGLHGWCGRYDLAQKLAAQAAAKGYQDVRIVEVPAA